MSGGCHLGTLIDENYLVLIHIQLPLMRVTMSVSGSPQLEIGYMLKDLKERVSPHSESNQCNGVIENLSSNCG